MRLGGFFRANRVQDLAPLCEKLDTHGLAAIPAPARLAEMAPDECATFGERARELRIVLQTAKAQRFPLVTAAAAHQLLMMASGAGYGTLDDAAVVKVFEELLDFQVVDRD